MNVLLWDELTPWVALMKNAKQPILLFWASGAAGPPGGDSQAAVAVSRCLLQEAACHSWRINNFSKYVHIHGQAVEVVDTCKLSFDTPVARKSIRACILARIS